MDTPICVSWHSDTGNRTAIIVKRGHKFLSLVFMDKGVRVKRVHLREERYMKPLTYKGKPYPILRAKRHYERHGRMCGITMSAKRALGEIWHESARKVAE